MDDVASAQNENENLRKIRQRLLQWEGNNAALASINAQQEEYLETLTGVWQNENSEKVATSQESTTVESKTSAHIGSSSLSKLKSEQIFLSSTNDFLLWFDENVVTEIEQQNDAASYRYLEQLEQRSEECGSMLKEITAAMERLDTLSDEYKFVSQKAGALNTASEQLIEEQEKLQGLSNEIQRRLHFFSQVESIQQRLQSPTLSVASEAFRECLQRIDESLDYLKANPNFKDAAIYTVKYKQCLSKAVSLMKNYVIKVMEQATEATLHPKQSLISTNNEKDNSISTAAGTPEAAFALYYGKYQTSAAKVKRISQLVECRLEQSSEYEQLLADMQQSYLSTRASVMSPAVEKAINELKVTHKGDHCSLTRSACAFLVHVSQDEHRLYFQFFGHKSEQLNAYLEGLCTILYDNMRPYIIHINHLETLAEICSILRIEMLKEHVQHNPEALEAFANTANQLLQDVQERLVFRAYLYLQSDILNYNPSAGDLAYPEKLEMMESIALSLQEPQQHMRRSDSRSSVYSSVSSAIETESVDTSYRARNMNSPADLHGMWYPTVRRTLVCLSRLYRCVDRPIFQGLSQEALKLCIQSVSAAAGKISAAKTPIDGELFQIKHLLILREQIAPFRVDFTVKETSLDFSKVKTAAFGLLQKRKQLFSMGSNNALLEFLLEGTPQIKEHLLDSRKEVDRQLKLICEQFIKDAGQMLVGPLISFLDRAQTLVSSNVAKTDEATNTSTAAGASTTTTPKVNYALRQSAWASPQQISSIIQETQRLIKSKLATLQRAMQLYLSNRDTEFIIFRPIRNNIIQAFVKLEQLLTANGYTTDDMIITSCPTAEQISVLISSASILAAEGIANFSAARKISTSSTEGVAGATSTTVGRKTSFDKKSVSFDGAGKQMENVVEVPESGESNGASPTAEKTPINEEPLTIIENPVATQENTTSTAEPTPAELETINANTDEDDKAQR